MRTTSGGYADRGRSVCLGDTFHLADLETGEGTRSNFSTRGPTVEFTLIHSDNGDPRDTSRSGYDEFLSGSPAFTTDSLEGTRALKFDGVDGSVTINQLMFNRAFSQQTVSSWFKSDANTINQVICDTEANTGGLAVHLSAGKIEATVAARLLVLL